MYVSFLEVFKMVDPARTERNPNQMFLKVHWINFLREICEIGAAQHPSLCRAAKSAIDEAVPEAVGPEGPTAATLVLSPSLRSELTSKLIPCVKAKISGYGQAERNRISNSCDSLAIMLKSRV